MKKILALLLAVVMICAIAIPACAEDKVYNVIYLVNGNLGDKSFFDSAEAGLEQLKADGVEDIQTYFNDNVKIANSHMAPYKKVGLVKIRKTDFVKNTSRKITRFSIDKSID